MRFQALPEDVDQRLDQWLAVRLAPLSRSQVQQEIRRGGVLVNGSPRPANYRMHAADSVEAPALDPDSSPVQDTALKPASIPLSIVYEDEHLLIVDKPAGLVVHPAPGHPESTLAQALLAHCGPSVAGIGGPERCGIVHRLDKLTSGLLIAAKTEEAHVKLTAALAERQIQRRYLAIAVGPFVEAEGEIDKPIGRRRTNRKQMGIVTEGREARTSYRRIEVAHGLGLLLIRLQTGRTHQIRVHFQSIGRPILGDPIYGWTKARVMSLATQDFRSTLAAHWPARQMLHAAEIELDHPVTGEPIRRTSLPPEDMAGLIRLVFKTPLADIFAA